MKKAAQITDGCVSNLIRIEDDAPVPEGWVEADAAVRINDVYDGQTFTPPAAPVVPFEDAKANALAEVNAAHASYLRALLESASQEERDTWPIKASAAKAYMAGTATDAQTALIETEAAGGGISPDDLAEKIINKNELEDAAYHDHIGQAAALRASGRAAVKAAATHDDLQAAREAFYAEALAAFQTLAGGQS
ncbi:FAD-binding dehydrogenase [Roseobacter sp. HKCCD9010]|uniref:FAD-binding dehydrogenase n=1 Tax=unclassified Roseobacter TaxID=196798 RepID=UPI0014915320|nr:MULTISPECIES: FAD-binding dehydrogenase [unclassified Roseobacter]MBF9049879.1 FAD-binding dehydrogenase [Rhodobacterales bacterium HKCCD4356]NNV13582.1 FAD-binding dehydrogenase [Roseobacter sp. HKCCD7357]NNV16416.1 FAD-binding dehydrogenase [Roseobacter sp. HKCCD8768]NNV25875.1 FAD-binding dehydrogenase [Roseobacter sp. HKCCD8192]NNV30133.1 FAD-binding dehydrogenase [Roseobacter sp. HKCCD9061]